MLRTIIFSLFVFLIIALITIWIMTGSPRKIYTYSRNAITNAVVVDPDEMRLPWQPAKLLPTIDLTDSLLIGEDTAPKTPQEQLANIEAEYDRLTTEVQKTRTFGKPSPYVGTVAIVQNATGVRGDSPRDEYIEIVASSQNTTSINITSWSLESALSGTRVLIPPAASPYLANVPNTVTPVSLEPGAEAIVSSALSPVGISFRENMCTGYLQQFQEFNPPLTENCPLPSSVLPYTVDNLQSYGDACFDALQYLPTCRYPQNLANVSYACSTHLATTLSYNGCVHGNRFRPSFTTNSWRLFLGASTELWRNSHDAIRLLDAEGRTVSVFVY